MTTETVAAALERLRRAADRASQGWLPQEWTRVAGPGPDVVRMVPTKIWSHAGLFQPLALEPDSELTLQTALDIPARVAGVAVTGEPLELTVYSLYPIHLSHEGRALLDEGVPPAAAGPALIEVLPALGDGTNGRLTARIRTPDHQLTPFWCQFGFSTPSLRDRFGITDRAWAQLRLASALAEGPEDAALVTRAAELVPQEIDLGDRGLLQNAFGEMADRLAPFQERISRLRVHLIGHSHIDLQWLWTWDDAREVIKRDVSSVLAMMDDYPEMTFTHSQPATYEVVRTEEPALFARILEHVRSGRWEPATMQWVEGDTNLAGGESSVRQLLEGVRYTREHLGVSPGVFLAPDTFGHAGNLPQMAASAGARAYYHHRCSPGEENGGSTWWAYWWEGLDGTRILGVATPSYGGQITAGALAEAALRQAHEPGLPCAMHFYGVVDHGGGPTRQSLDELRQVAATPLMPTAFCSTVGAYADEIMASGAALPVHRGESRTVFQGCYTTHADAKRCNRRAENLLMTAEALAVQAGLAPPPRLRQAWRTQLFHQFHDILDGSSIAAAYAVTAEDFDILSGIAEGVVEESLGRLCTAGTEDDVVVVNPLGFERTDLVVLSDLPGHGHPLLADGSGGHVAGQRGPGGVSFVATVPAFGVAHYRVAQADPAVTPETPEEPISVEPHGGDDLATAPWLRIRTPHLVAHLHRPSGSIATLRDLRTGTEMVGSGRALPRFYEQHRPELTLNVLQVTDEHPHDMSSWQLHEVYREESLVRGAETRIVEHGPVRLVVEVRHRVRSSTILERISFHAELPRIDVELEVDWQELGGREAGIPGLEVSFTSRLESTEAWYEIPYGAARRPADGLEVPALRWADVGNAACGMAVLNDSKHGHDALGARLRMRLIRSAYDPDLASDIGRHQVRYSIVPHPGDWRSAGIPQQAAGFNQPLLAVPGVVPRPDRPGALRPVIEGAPSVLIGAVKHALEGGAIVVRLHESHGITASAVLRGLPDGARVVDATLTEDERGELRAVRGSVAIALRPWEVRTLLVTPGRSGGRE